MGYEAEELCFQWKSAQCYNNYENISYFVGIFPNSFLNLDSHFRKSTAKRLKPNLAPGYQHLTKVIVTRPGRKNRKLKIRTKKMMTVRRNPVVELGLGTTL